MSNTVHQDELFAAMAQKGVVITEVETGSEADKSGLKTGHIVTRVDGASVPTPRDFYKSAAGLTGPAKLKTDVGDFVVK